MCYPRLVYNGHYCIKQLFEHIHLFKMVVFNNNNNNNTFQRNLKVLML